MSSRTNRALLAAAFAGVMTLGLASAQSTAGADKSAGKDKMSMGGADHKFVMEAAEGGMAEVKLGQLAVEKASSADVKQFGQKMVDDHSKANEKLQSLASQKGMTLATGIGAKNQALYDRLSKLSGAEFDQAYMKSMTADHKKDVAEFEKTASRAKDADIKSFASSTLPTLQEHLRMAEDVYSKLGGATSADRMKSTGMKSKEK